MPGFSEGCTINLAGGGLCGSRRVPKATRHGGRVFAVRFALVTPDLARSVALYLGRAIPDTTVVLGVLDAVAPSTILGPDIRAGIDAARANARAALQLFQHVRQLILDAETVTLAPVAPFEQRYSAGSRAHLEEVSERIVAICGYAAESAQHWQVQLTEEKSPDNVVLRTLMDAWHHLAFAAERMAVPGPAAAAKKALYKLEAQWFGGDGSRADHTVDAAETVEGYVDRVNAALSRLPSDEELMAYHNLFAVLLRNVLSGFDDARRTVETLRDVRDELNIVAGHEVRHLVESTGASVAERKGKVHFPTSSEETGPLALAVAALDELDQAVAAVPPGHLEVANRAGMVREKILEVWSVLDQAAVATAQRAEQAFGQLTYAATGQSAGPSAATLPSAGAVPRPPRARPGGP